MKFYILHLCRRDKSMAVFTESQLKRLKAHKYCSEGSSVTEFIFQPFWNYVVTLMPLWLAPNLITILGLIVNVATSTLILLYSPKADSDDVSFLHVYFLKLDFFVSFVEIISYFINLRCFFSRQEKLGKNILPFQCSNKQL